MTATLTLAQRCGIHATKADEAGMYVTANVLAAAGERIEALESLIEAQHQRMKELEAALGVQEDMPR